MTDIFLCGAMAWPPVLRLLAGDAADGARPAVLPDAAILSEDGCCFPVCVAQVGRTAEGILLRDAPRDVLDRATFLAAGLGMDPVDRHIEGGAVRCFLAAPAPLTQTAEWKEALWAERWGAHAGLAVQEILTHMGRFFPEDLRGRMSMILSRAEARLAARDSAPATLRTALEAGTAEVLDRQTPHAGFFLTRSYTLRHPGFDGTMSPTLMREVFVATDAAIVLPYDPVRDRLLLVEQFRMGPFGRGDPLPWVLEPVAGRVDAGERPETTARRECMEEAGLALRGLEHVSSHYCSPGCSTEVFHCYVGLCDLPDLERGTGGLETEDEDIRTHVLGFEAALELTRTGEANIGPLVLLLLWLERERPRLRAIA